MDNNILFRYLSGADGFRGFHLTETHHLAELQCDAWLLSHESGADFLYLDTGTQEKTYSLSFRLSPEDHTGVAHIIEHTMLSGSQKYKVRSWGGDGLLCSFNGAFTMRDSSMYPVSSENEKSFQELVKIYSDCVFAPSVLLSDINMRQEGWHYEYDQKTDSLSYSGIVYSEMQSAYQMPEFVLATTQMRAACRDTSLFFDVGGDPAYIPDLTYEHFLNTYDQVFIPENCLAFACGQTELSSVLETLEPYLNNAAKGRTPCRIKGRPSKWSGRPYVESYPLMPGESARGKAFIGISWVIPCDRKTVIAAEILTKMLDLKLKEKLPQYQIEIICQRDNYWPMITLTVRNTEEEEITCLESCVASVLQSVQEQGFSGDDIRSAINAVRFAAAEKIDFVPEGVDLGIKVTTAWSHGQKPWTNLETEEYFKGLSEMNLPEFFADLLQNCLLENELYSQFILKGDPGLTEKRNYAERQRLNAFRSTLTKEQFTGLVKEIERLHKIQKVPDDPEDVEKLPRTEIEDLEKKAPVRYVEEAKTAGGTVLFYNDNTNVIKMTLHYHLPAMTREEYYLLGILKLLFGKCGMPGTSPEKLQGDIHAVMDKLDMSLASFQKEGADYAKLQIQFGCLPEYFETAQILVEMIIKASADAECRRTKEMLSQFIASFSASVPDSAAMVRSSYSPGASALRAYGGLGLYGYAKELLENFEASFPLLKKSLKNLSVKIFDISQRTVSISCRRDIFEEISRKLRFGSVLPKDSLLEAVTPEACPLSIAKEAVRIAGNMQYTAMGARVPAVTGALLASARLGESFAVDSVRDVGGAYHAKVRITTDGELLLLSGRDPHLSETIDNFKKLPDLIKTASDAQIKTAVIAALASFSSASSVGLTGYQSISPYEQAVRNYFSGYTPKKQQKIWDQLLSVTPDAVRRCHAVWKEAVSAGHYCSAVSEAALEKEAGLFEHIISLSDRNGLL